MRNLGTLALSVLILALSGCADPLQTVSADLAFWFDCGEGTDPPSSQAIERFLRDNSFAVVDVVRFRREQNLPPMSQTLFIDGIDTQQRMINFVGSPNKKGSYSADLYTPPPTRRSADLEEAILTFVSNQLKCNVRQISRKVNSSERREYYDKIFNIVKQRVIEAKQ